MERARTQLGATRPGKDIVVDGVRLAYDDAGAGPALVCLHAIGHGASDFAALRARIGAGRRVIALDWPGHGSSADDREPAKAARYEALLAGFLDALGLARATLLGNSIGGAAALRLAAHAPGRVRALVLVNPGGLDKGGALARAMPRAMARFFEAGARGARWYPAAFAAYYRLVLPRAPEQRARIVAAARESAAVLAQAWRGFAEPDADVRQLAERVRCRTLVAWAKGDRINQLSRCRPALRRLPNARLVTFSGGHAPFLEDPDAFAPVLDDFLRETERDDTA